MASGRRGPSTSSITRVATAGSRHPRMRPSRPTVFAGAGPTDDRRRPLAGSTWAAYRPEIGVVQPPARVRPSHHASITPVTSPCCCAACHRVACPHSPSRLWILLGLWRMQWQTEGRCACLAAENDALPASSRRAARSSGGGGGRSLGSVRVPADSAATLLASCSLSPSLIFYSVPSYFSPSARSRKARTSGPPTSAPAGELAMTPRPDSLRRRGRTRARCVRP